MREVIVLDDVDVGLVSEAEVDVALVRWEDLSPAEELGVSVKSTSSHQSSSVQFWMPQAANHFLLPSGTKNSQFGCPFAISVTVGWERWS